MCAGTLSLVSLVKMLCTLHVGYFHLLPHLLMYLVLNFAIFRTRSHNWCPPIGHSCSPSLPSATRAEDIARGSRSSLPRIGFYPAPFTRPYLAHAGLQEVRIPTLSAVDEAPSGKEPSSNAGFRIIHFTLHFYFYSHCLLDYTYLWLTQSSRDAFRRIRFLNEITWPLAHIFGAPNTIYPATRRPRT